MNNKDSTSDGGWQRLRHVGGPRRCGFGVDRVFCLAIERHMGEPWSYTEEKGGRCWKLRPPCPIIGVDDQALTWVFNVLLPG
jgi:hypothetical protein